MIDYTIFTRQRWSPTEPWPPDWKWDVFISAMDSTHRVQTVFQLAPAQTKYWLVLTEYGYTDQEVPKSDTTVKSPGSNEADFVAECVRVCGDNLLHGRLCIDSSGFVTHHFLALIYWLHLHRTNPFDILYSAPVRYERAEHTQFTAGPVVEVRPVAGYEGVHEPSADKPDWLVIGSGYDDETIRKVAEHKNSARKLQMFGLPSLQPDMYQESVLGADLAAESVGVTHDPDSLLFAPAHDPFSTASVLQSAVGRLRRGGMSNLYLSPVGTKAQALGFAVYYLGECKGTATTLLMPLAARYARESSYGLGRVWRYTMEFPLSGPTGRPNPMPAPKARPRRRSA